MKVLITIIILLLSMTLAAASPPAARVQVNAILNNAAVLTINGKQQMIRKMAKSSEGYQLVVIAQDSVTLLIAGEKQVFKLGAAVTSSKAGRSGKQSVNINRDRNGMYYSRGTINGKTVDFLVDTGATFIAMNSILANQLGIDYLNKGTIGKIQTASGIVTAWQVKLDKVTLGEVELLFVEAAVVEGSFPKQTLLGMSFLSRVKLKNDGLLMTIEEKN
ncbi:MAG: TIGR02281 family clan AA aspartic protease [Gammaproteobacteria bacterium]|nr:MAG: TIGR02281 family clan AA aspartic protease [Gammaproteobacteria bacterium]